MNFDLVPQEKIDSKDLKESARYFLTAFAEEIKPHGLYLIVSNTLYPCMDNNFKIATVKDGDILDRICESFKTLAEVDDSYGYIIREYGQSPESKNFISDRFLPFSSLMELKDEKFPRIAEEEKYIIEVFARYNSLGELYDLAKNHSIVDAMMEIIFDGVKKQIVMTPFHSVDVCEIRKPLVNLIYTRLFKSKRCKTNAELVKALPELFS